MPGYSRPLALIWGNGSGLNKSNLIVSSRKAQRCREAVFDEASGNSQVQVRREQWSLCIRCAAEGPLDRPGLDIIGTVNRALAAQKAQYGKAQLGSGCDAVLGVLVPAAQDKVGCASFPR